MRIIAIVLNCILIGVVLLLVITEGFPEKLEELLTVIGILLFLIFNIIALSFPGSASWLTTVIKRKKLEELRRI